MTITRDNAISDENDGNVSAYLRRPLRTLDDYLKEPTQRRCRAQRVRSDESHQLQSVAENGGRGKEQ